MKKVWMLLFITGIIGGCQKSEMSPAIAYKEGELKPVRLPKPFLPEPICIQSFQDLQSTLGRTSFDVQSVMLEDGTMIWAGIDVLSMVYYAEEKKEDFSLFRSHLVVQYNLYGYLQQHHNNAWSLGCVYQDAGLPPFANLYHQGPPILINTHFVWGVPVKEAAGKRVLRIFVK